MDHVRPLCIQRGVGGGQGKGLRVSTVLFSIFFYVLMSLRSLNVGEVGVVGIRHHYCGRLVALIVPVNVLSVFMQFIL